MREPYITSQGPLLSSQLPAIRTHTGQLAPRIPPFLPVLDSDRLSWLNLPPDIPTLFSSPTLITLWHVFSVYCFSLPHKDINSMESCLFCSLLDPQDLALGGPLMNISLMNGTPLVSFFSLICRPESGLKSGTSISNTALFLFCGLKPCWWNRFLSWVLIVLQVYFHRKNFPLQFLRGGRNLLVPSESGLVWRWNKKGGITRIGSKKVFGDLCFGCYSTQHYLYIYIFIIFRIVLLC